MAISRSWLFEAPLPHAPAAGELELSDREGNSGVTFRKFTQPFRTPWMQRAEQLLIQHIRRRRVDSNTAGRVFRQLTAKDLRAQGAQEKFGRPGRRPDIGNRHEVTLQGHGPFDDNKLAQLRKDLGDVGTVLLTVPFLSRIAEEQLKQLGQEQLKAHPGSHPTIIVRQTHAAPVFRQSHGETELEDELGADAMAAFMAGRRTPAWRAARDAAQREGAALVDYYLNHASIDPGATGRSGGTARGMARKSAGAELIRRAKTFPRTDLRRAAYRSVGEQLIVQGNADIHPGRR
jgi:hypothetical protein